MSKKRCLSFYYIIFFVFLQVFFVGVGGNVNVLAEEEENKPTETQKNIIVDHCDTIKDNLRSVQRTDSRARVYLGRYYETILSSFMTPLNVRLVENNISNTALLDNQTKFAARRTQFVNDFITYQQELENLVNVNCKTEPEKFYRGLLNVREKRAIVNRDVVRLKQFTDEQVKLTKELKTTLTKEAGSGGN